MRVSERGRRSSSAVLIYVIVLMAMQVFLVTVAAEAFLADESPLAWATATFWFPLMIAIGIWRHLVRRVPLRYHPSYWAMVFPLGMYGVATFRMRVALDLDALAWLPPLELAVALTAWAITFGGLLHHLGTRALNKQTG